MVEIAQFRNPWYNKQNQEYYKVNSNTRISEYKGFHLITGVHCWVDVVEFKDDEYVCVTQRGSVRNAKQFIDNTCDK